MYEVADQDGKSVGKVHVEDPSTKGRLVRKIRRKKKLKQALWKSVKSTPPLLRDIARTLEFQRPRLTRASEIDREKLA